MLNLVLASFALAFLPTAPALADNPLIPPPSWKTEKQDGSVILTPGDLAKDKFYAVMVTMMPTKAGSLDSILADGKKMAAEIGTFKAAIEPRKATSDGGWDYQFVLGEIEMKDRSVVAQVIAIKKGDDGGVVIVLSESVATMTHYADTLGAMLRSMGGTKAAPAASSGVVDLKYRVPEGWVEQKVNGFPLLVKEKNEVWVKFRMSLLIFPSEPIAGTTREQFEGFWNAFVKPNYTTNIAPIPLMSRMKSGHALAFDADSEAKDKNGNTVTVAIYMIAHGGRVVPVMGIYSGGDWLFDKGAEGEIGQFLDTAVIRGTSSTQVELFPSRGIAGDWSESGSEHAVYVRRDGSYAGDATISTAAYWTLGADGTYSRTLMAISRDGNIREKDAGTWTVEDDELVLSKGGRYSLLGYGVNPKLGRFLIIGNYPNQKVRLKFTNPRGILQAQWLKSK